MSVQHHAISVVKERARSHDNFIWTQELVVNYNAVNKFNTLNNHHSLCEMLSRTAKEETDLDTSPTSHDADFKNLFQTI